MRISQSHLVPRISRAAALLGLALVAGLCLPGPAAAWRDDPDAYPRLATYADAIGSLGAAQLDTLSWFDVATLRGNPDAIAELRARNPEQVLLYRTLPQNICSWGDPEDPSWYPDTSFNLNLLCKFYAIQNDWYLYDIYGEKIEEWSGYAANWTRYCPAGTYGTSVGMTYAEWYVDVALPQIAYQSPEWERWGEGSSAFNGLAWEILVDCPQFWNPEQFAIADPDRDGEIEGIEDLCWEGGTDDSLSILYREMNEYVYSRLWEVLDDDLIVNITSTGISVNPWWQWELSGLKIEGWKPDGPLPIQSWWSSMYGHHAGGEIKRGGYAFAERYMHPHGIDRLEGWDATWIFVKTFGEEPHSDYWTRMRRWGLGTTMLGDGYFAMEPGQGEYNLWWFDEYDWNFGGAVDDMERQLFGSDTLYTRTFEKGRVEVNPNGRSLGGIAPNDARFLFWLTLEDLAATEVGPDSVTLTWVAPGCETNDVDITRIRYAIFPITPENWDDCQLGPPPFGDWGDEGEQLYYTVRDLVPNTTYYFAAKNLVLGVEEPGISNVVMVTTGEGLPPAEDETPPAAIGDVAAPSQGESWLRITWSATGDDGLEGTADHYELRYLTGETIEDESDWARAEPLLEGLPTPGPPGQPQSCYVRDLAAGTSYGIAVRAVDEADNISGLSNVLLATTAPPGDHTPPYAIEDFDLEEIFDDGFDLVWTATGDDGDQGTAERYILGYREDAAISNESDWAAAVHSSDGLPAPQPAGAAQAGSLRTLQPGTRYGITLRAEDESGNLSPIGNCLILQTSGVAPDETPPGGISDFALEEASETALHLSWTAPGDDGSDGTADRFVLAWREGGDPITSESDWDAANHLSAGLPSPPSGGEPVSWSWTDLLAGSDYSLALRAYDEAQNAGAISNALVASTLPEAPPGGEQDTLPPCGIEDLELVEVGDSWARLSWSCPGDDGQEGWASRFVLGWLSGAELETEADWEVAEKVAAGLPAADTSGTVVTYDWLGLESGASYSVAVRAYDDADLLSPLTAPLLVTPGVPPAPVHDLAAPVQGQSWLQLSWTASGDDSLAGQADHYLLRYRTAAPIECEEDWQGATPVSGGLPDPSPAGGSETFTLGGLEADTAYGVALRVVDTHGNCSGLSNALLATTCPPIDETPPGAIDTLNAIATYTDGFDLEWVAPGDDGAQGRASRYILGYLVAFPIENEDDWIAAVQVTEGLPQPQPAGERENFALRGLVPATLYGITLRAEDESGNLSPIGNCLILQTSGVAPDETPPGGISDFALEEATETALHLSWTAPGDDGSDGTADRFVLAWREGGDPITSESDWDAANHLSAGLPSPPSGGEPVSWSWTDLLAGSDYSLALRAYDEAQNAGAISNALVASTLPEAPPGGEQDTLPPCGIEDLELVEVGDSWARLSWSCPGDDGQEGWASRFVLGWLSGAELETEADWEVAEKVAAGLPAADTSGTVVTYDWLGLESGASYSVAVRAYDDADLLSPPGATCSFTTAIATDPDTLAPAAVCDLHVTGLGDDWLQIAWGATCDDSIFSAPVGYRIGIVEDGEICAERWDEVDRLEEFPATRAGEGELQSYMLAGLATGHDYGIAMRAIDTAGNRSVLSNCIWVADLSSRAVRLPETVADLSALAAGTDWAELRWRAPPIYEPEGPAVAYALAYASAPFDEQGWSAARRAPDLPLPAAPGATEQFRLTALEPGCDYWIGVRACDRIGNWSPLGSAIWVATHAADSQAPAAPGAPLATISETEERIRLSWTAVADTDLLGYYVHGRVASDPAAVKLHSQPVATTSWSFPSPIGDQQYYVSISAIDVSGNEGPRGAEAPVWAWEPQLRGPFPHPIEDQGEFHLILPPGAAGNAHVRAVFFSVLGEPVRRWIDETYPTGSQVRLVWDRRNDAGARVAPGLYFLRVETAGAALMRKVYVGG